MAESIYILEKLPNFLLKSLLFILVFLIFYILGVILRKIIRKKIEAEFIYREILTLFSDLFFYALIIVGFIVGLSIVGVNINAILAGLGLGGFAIGLALKDIIVNFVSGFLIILTKTFNIGDYLKIGELEGIVKSINLRHTVLIDKNDPKTKILIPNGHIFSSPIKITREKNKK
jgi:small-conductance mechanosensitive channel